MRIIRPVSLIAGAVLLALGLAALVRAAPDGIRSTAGPGGWA